VALSPHSVSGGDSLARSSWKEACRLSLAFSGRSQVYGNVHPVVIDNVTVSNNTAGTNGPPQKDDNSELAPVTYPWL
jgi:hypothetical protein